MQVWRVHIEQSRTWDGIMLAGHKRVRYTQQVVLPSLIPTHDAQDRIKSSVKLHKHERILRAERWKEVA